MPQSMPQSTNASINGDIHAQQRSDLNVRDSDPYNMENPALRTQKWVNQATLMQKPIMAQTGNFN
jgi:hypothetical protein